jgi:hypothetical protein
LTAATLTGGTGICWRWLALWLTRQLSTAAHFALRFSQLVVDFTPALTFIAILVPVERPPGMGGCASGRCGRRDGCRLASGLIVASLVGIAVGMVLRSVVIWLT